MGISSTPEGRLAIEFSKLVVAGRYQEAYGHLSPAAQQEWKAEALKKHFDDMTGYFESSSPTVSEEYAMETFSNEKGRFIYVPIVGDGESEAIIVGINKENEIFSVEFGRP